MVSLSSAWPPLNASEIMKSDKHCEALQIKVKNNLQHLNNVAEVAKKDNNWFVRNMHGDNKGK